MQQHLIEVWTSSSYRVTRTVSLTIAVLSILALFFPGTIVDMFALTPGFIFGQYTVWTFVTAALVNLPIINGLIGLSLFILLTGDLEHSWGSTSFTLLISIVAVATNVSLFVIRVFLYAVTFDESFVFKSVYGITAVNAALIVVLKQRHSEKPVFDFFAALKYKHLPIIIFMGAMLSIAISPVSSSNFILTLFGTYYGWLYLRYFRTDYETGVTGDLRPEFAFSTLFPDIAQVRAFVDLFTVFPYQLILSLGLIEAAIKSNATLPLQSDSTDPATATLMGNHRIDPAAERRRALAIKAIDDKLAELARIPTNRDQNGPVPSTDTRNASVPSDAELERLEQQFTSNPNQPLIASAVAASDSLYNNSDRTE